MGSPGPAWRFGLRFPHLGGHLPVLRPVRPNCCSRPSSPEQLLGWRYSGRPFIQSISQDVQGQSD